FEQRIGPPGLRVGLLRCRSVDHSRLRSLFVDPRWAPQIACARPVGPNAVYTRRSGRRPQLVQLTLSVNLADVPPLRPAAPTAVAKWRDSQRMEYRPYEQLVA